jgi:hypothetical protein
MEREASSSKFQARCRGPRRLNAEVVSGTPVGLDPGGDLHHVLVKHVKEEREVSMESGVNCALD